jgi:hypothetical protein
MHENGNVCDDKHRKPYCEQCLTETEDGRAASCQYGLEEKHKI